MAEDLSINYRKILEDLICDKNLEFLEKKDIGHFNIFNAIGMHHQEIKHSNFLAWLFNPKEKHSLQDFVIKNFLKEVLKKYSDNLPKEAPSIFDVDSWDLSDLIVERENCNIDILFIDKKNNFICVIENKIKAKQQKSQLYNYEQKVQKEYSNFKFRLFLYLKPVEDEEIKEPYLYVSYEVIKNIIDEILQVKKSYISNDMLLVLKHYKELLEREIMVDEKTIELCQKIYNAHKEAFKLIIDNVDLTSVQTKIAEVLVPIFEERGYKRIKGKGSRNIKFLPKNVKENQDIYFKIWNTGGVSDRYELKLELNTEKGFDEEKLKKLRGCLNIKNNAKKIETILEKKFLEEINESVEEAGCMTEKQKEKVEKSFKKILDEINIEEVEKILNA